MAKRHGVVSGRCLSTYQIELANKIGKVGIFRGRAMGNEYVVTQRPLNRSGILARFDDRDDARRWIHDQCRR